MGSEHSHHISADRMNSFQNHANNTTQAQASYQGMVQSYQQYPQQQQQQQQQQTQQQPQQSQQTSYTQYTQNQVQYPTYTQTAGAQPTTQQQQQAKRLSQYSQLQYPQNSVPIPINNVNNQLSISNQHLNQLATTPSQTMNQVPYQNGNYQNGNTQPFTPLHNTHYFTLPNGLNGAKKDDSFSDVHFKMGNITRPLSETNIFQKSSGIFGSLKSQKLFVIRHGERVDTTFGPTWVENGFDNSGRYIRFNLNMPKTLPQRENPKLDYLFDPPLTEMGLHQAKLTGEELLSQGITLAYCYASPALRSIQTADKILEGMNLKNVVPIRVELGLFEFLRWQVNMPNKYPFMDLRSLVQAGYNIDLTYKPIFTYDMLRFDETEEIYYQRSYFMTKTITDRHSDGGNIMFAGHAPTIEVCTRQLCGGEIRANEFRNIVRKVPFLAIAQCERNPITHQWKLKKPPIPALKHLAVDEFDWKNLQNTSTINQQKLNESSTYFQQYQTQPPPQLPQMQQIPVVQRNYVPWRV